MTIPKFQKSMTIPKKKKVWVSNNNHRVIYGRLVFNFGEVSIIFLYSKFKLSTHSYFIYYSKKIKFPGGYGPWSCIVPSLFKGVDLNLNYIYGADRNHFYLIHESVRVNTNWTHLSSSCGIHQWMLLESYGSDTNCTPTFPFSISNWTIFTPYISM